MEEPLAQEKKKKAIGTGPGHNGTMCVYTSAYFFFFLFLLPSRPVHIDVLLLFFPYLVNLVAYRPPLRRRHLYGPLDPDIALRFRQKLRSA